VIETARLPKGFAIRLSKPSMSPCANGARNPLSSAAGKYVSDNPSGTIRLAISSAAGCPVSFSMIRLAMTSLVLVYFSALPGAK
jgi:hypothetical protein